MTRISDMTPLSGIPPSGLYAPVERAGSTTNYRLDLGALSNPTPQQYGGVADGVTDTSTYFAQIEANTAADTPVIISGGTFYIAANLTINRPLVFTDGKIAIPNGVTLTLNKGIEAPAQQIFVCTGTGKVVFDWTKTSAGPMEWWGAKADASVYCDTAWTAAHTALHRVLGQPGDYLFQHLAKIPGPHMGFIGSGEKYTSGTAQATRLLLASATENILQIGPDAFPGSINAMPQGIEVRDFYVGRNVAPDIPSAPISVRNQYTLGAVIERVKTQDSIIGWSFYGTVATKCIEPQSTRAVAGTGVGTDSWKAFDITGTAAIGASGANASLYIIRPSYTCSLAALQTGNSIGLNIGGAFTDLFIDRPEGSSCRDDIVITGNGLSTLDVGNCDLRINHPTSDQFYRYGISITNLAATGIIQITSPYLGPNSGATATLNITGCAGTITLVGGEALHHSAPAVKPVNISSSEGVQLLGFGLLECSTAAVTLADVKNCRIQPMISNKVNTGGIAVSLSGTCTANLIAPMVKGKASGFTKGIDVAGTADDRNEYNLTGIDSACIASGSANKLVRNSVQIVATGLTGTNLVSGVVA